MTIEGARGKSLLELAANLPDDPEGCIACGAMAGCCTAYPNCPGNPDWMPPEMFPSESARRSNMKRNDWRTMADKRKWWEPVLTDATYFARLRKDYPENAHQSDDWLRDYYADGRRYVVTWDHVGDAYDQFEELADAYLALKSAPGKSE